MLEWPPRGRSPSTATFCFRLYRSGTIDKKPWFDELSERAKIGPGAWFNDLSEHAEGGRLRSFRLVAVPDTECRAQIGPGAIACAAGAAGQVKFLLPI